MKTLRFQWILALAASVTASAQPPEPRGDRRPPPVPLFFAVFDTNHDRVLSDDEIEAASGALGKMDRNGDGQITLDELRMPPPGRPPVPPVIAALDADKDGTISAEELENSPESLKRLDRNGDGALSPEELRPKGPPPRADGQGGVERPQGPPPEVDGEIEGVE